MFAVNDSAPPSEKVCQIASKLAQVIDEKQTLEQQLSAANNELGKAAQDLRANPGSPGSCARFLELHNIKSCDPSKVSALTLQMLQRGNIVSRIIMLLGCKFSDAVYLLFALNEFKAGRLADPRNHLLDRTPSSPSLPVSKWNMKVVCEWLQQNGLAQLQQVYLQILDFRQSSAHLVDFLHF